MTRNHPKLCNVCRGELPIRKDLHESCRQNIIENESYHLLRNGQPLK